MDIVGSHSLGPVKTQPAREIASVKGLKIMFGFRKKRSPLENYCDLVVENALNCFGTTAEVLRNHGVKEHETNFEMVLGFSLYIPISNDLRIVDDTQGRVRVRESFIMMYFLNFADELYKHTGGNLILTKRDAPVLIEKLFQFAETDSEMNYSPAGSTAYMMKRYKAFVELMLPKTDDIGKIFVDLQMNMIGQHMNLSAPKEIFESQSE